MNNLAQKQYVESAGVIVIDWNTEEPSVLCVSAYGMWDFPKGRLEKGENHMQAAIRELAEETSLIVPDDAKVIPGAVAPSITYNSGKKIKTATYFIAYRNSKKVPYLPVNPELGMPENNAFRWIPFSKLRKVMPSRLSPIVSYIEEWIHSGETF